VEKAFMSTEKIKNKNMSASYKKNYGQVAEPNAGVSVPGRKADPEGFGGNPPFKYRFATGKAKVAVVTPGAHRKATKRQLGETKDHPVGNATPVGNTGCDSDE
jgi:hypothetical protein